MIVGDFVGNYWCWVVVDQFVYVEVGFVEEYCVGQVQVGVEVGVEGCFEVFEFDVQVFQQVFGVFIIEGVW